MFLYMGMNETPSSERVHIGFFGRRNAGKSSLVNAVTGQDLSIVSRVRGTTTNPVGELGIKRVGKSRQVLNKTDIAILVVDTMTGTDQWEEEMVRLFEKRRFHILLYTIRQISAILIRPACYTKMPQQLRNIPASQPQMPLTLKVHP